MKKVLIALLAIALFACESESEGPDLYCWTCETTVEGAVVSTITACGIGETEIRDIQESLETQAVCLLGVVAETTCRKDTTL